jgi:hypothetical protein
MKWPSNRESKQMTVLRLAPPLGSRELQWGIMSSSGREHFGATFLSAAESAEATLLLTSAFIEGSFWPPQEFEDESAGAARSLSLDYHVALPQLVLDRIKLEEWTDELESWLSTPKEISLGLSGDRHQIFDISIGVRPDTICSIDRPVFSLSHASRSFAIGRWSFVIDQSCVRCLLEGLHQALSRGQR